MDLPKSFAATGQLGQEKILQLRINTLHRLIFITTGFGLSWHFYEAVVMGNSDLRIWSGPVMLVSSSLFALWIVSRWRFLPAVYTCITGITASILLAAWAYSQLQILFLLAVPAGIAVLLIHPIAGFVMAAPVGLALVSDPFLSGFWTVPDAVGWLVGISILVISLLLWVATYPVHTALYWAWSGYERARQKMEEARENRAQVARALKDLDAANKRLKEMAHELDRARRAANEARRLKAEFAANISHELRTPLNLIIGFSEVMALSPHTYSVPLPPAYRGDVQVIYRNAKHLSNLIDDVLDLSQIEAGRMGLTTEPFALPNVIQEAVKTVKPLFDKRGLWLNCDLPEALPTIEADRTRVRQVLINLLNNSVRFTRTGGATVSVSANHQEVTVSVADTGIGISEDDLPSAFQEFSQLDRSLSSQQGGSGLGLAISKKFVELHGGHMGVQSEMGNGTTFTFSLPLQPDMGISRPPSEWETWVRMAPQKKKEKSVAVLAPDDTTARLFERYLDDYRVVSVGNEAEAWQLSTQEVLHALIVIAPSGEEGWLMLRKARQRLPTVPALICTLRGGPTASRPPGVVTYLVKPVSQERFLQALDDLGSDVHSLLIVDDDPEVVRLLSRMVESASRSYRIFKAYSGTQAMTLLYEHRPDALVLDLLMPETDGYTVLEHMEADEALCEVPVIVVTAKGVEQEVITGGLVGVTRREGFSAGEMMRCLKANLDALHSHVAV